MKLFEESPAFVINLYRLPQRLIGDLHLEEPLQPVLKVAHFCLIKSISPLGYFARHAKNMYKGGEPIVYPDVGQAAGTIAGGTGNKAIQEAVLLP